MSNFYNVSKIIDNDTLSVNKVIRNTYMLLSLTLIFSSITAYVSMITNAKPMGFSSIFVYLGLLYFINTFKNNSLSILGVFILTGFLGYTLGPILNVIIHGFTNGSQLIGASLFLTGIIFSILSFYVTTTKQNFNYLGGFLFIGIIITIISTMIALLFNISVMHIVIAAVLIIISSGYILYETSRIVNGGEKNYILATVNLYVQIFNLFVSLLQLFAFFSGKKD